MKAIMACAGGRVPPGQNRRSPCPGSRWLTKLAVLVLGGLEPASHVAGQARFPAVALGPSSSHSFSVCAVQPDLPAIDTTRSHRRVVRLVIQHHPHRLITDLWRKTCSLSWSSLLHLPRSWSLP